MNWKNWPYWVKGGIIGIVLYILFFSVIFISGSNHCEKARQVDPAGAGMCGLATSWATVLLLFLIPLGAFIGEVCGRFKKRNAGSQDSENWVTALYWLKGGFLGLIIYVLVVLFSLFTSGGVRVALPHLAIYVIVGLVIGYIYGKIKNRNKSSPPSPNF